MSQKLLGGGSDLNTIVSDMNTNILDLKNREVTEIFKDKDGTQRVLLGEGANGFYGLKVSKSGKDVYNAADTDLVFNSGQNVFKIVGSLTIPGQTFTVNCSAGQVFSDVHQYNTAHTLGYAPLLYATSKSSTAGSYLVPRFVQQTIDPIRYYSLFTQMYSSTTQIVLEFITFISALNSGSSVSLNVVTDPVTFYILQESVTG